MKKTLIFDVGGVLILDLTFGDRWDKYKNQYNLDDRFEKKFLENETLYCLGKSCTDLNEYVKATYSQDDFDLVETLVDSFEENSSLINIVRDLEDIFNIVLLTNQYLGMHNLIKNKFINYSKLKINKEFDSSNLKLAKPDEAIYEYVQSSLQCNSDEILFIDNAKKNLLIPNKMGWDTFLYNPEEIDKSNKLFLQELKSFNNS